MRPAPATLTLAILCIAIALASPVLSAATEPLVHAEAATEALTHGTLATGDLLPHACEATAEVLDSTDGAVLLRLGVSWSQVDSRGEESQNSEEGPLVLNLRPNNPSAGAPSLAGGLAHVAGSGETWSARSPSPAGFSVLVRVPDMGRIVWSADQDGVVKISEPGILRDLRVVSVTYEPRPPTASVESARSSVMLRIETSPGTGVNEKRETRRAPAPAFEAVYRDRVINYAPDHAPDQDARTLIWGDLGNRDELPFGGKYLIITADSYESDIIDLAEWKHKKGVQTKVVTLSEVGSGVDDIRAYIQTAYDTWTVPPEYVLLVGDTEQLPAYEGFTWTDDYYATLEGADYFVDVMVGRISADSPSHCSTQVAKILGYERTPVTGDANWPTSATFMIAEDGDAGDAIYFANTWLIYDLMDAAGFAPMDTLFDRNGTVPDDVYAAVNAGRGFLTFRGQAWYEWPSPFNINPGNLLNGWKLPIIISATCGTGSYQNDGFICETFVRAGNAVAPRGAVAFFGSNTVIAGSQPLSRRRGAGATGFYEQVFGGNGGVLGAACVASKMSIYNFDAVQQEYEAWNLLGDPEMNLWIESPKDITVLHEAYYHSGQGTFAVSVLSQGQPVEGALVACLKDDDIYAWAYTDGTGQVSFPLTPTSSGALSVTVTAQGFVPYEGTTQVLDSGPFVVFADISIDDASGGNGDGLLSPGESADVSIEFGNVGDAVASSTVTVLRSSAPYATVVDSVSTFGDIAAQASSWGSPPLTITVSPTCRVGSVIPYELVTTYSGSLRTLSPPPIQVASADLDIVAVDVDDAPPAGDGGATASPGEVVGLTVTFENTGECDAESVTAEITTESPHIVIASATAALGDMAAGALRDNSETPFVLQISPMAPNDTSVSLRLVLGGQGHSYAYVETLDFDLIISGPTASLVTGPDDYGYYAFDSSDSTYGGAPAFDWYDIAPPGPGNLITEITDEDDAIALVNMPFSFQHYGTSYMQMSVCSNGFISMGAEDYRFGYNSEIPSTDGPENMIAMFWDDLDPSAGGDIYKWYDAAGSRFIIQFDEVPRFGTSDTETFQIVFLKESEYPTPTDDGMIFVQYETVTNPMECTVGIESPDESYGIEYLFDGDYNDSATPLVDGTAILFTTTPPSEPSLPWIVLTDVTLDDTTLGNGNGQIGPGETATLSVTLTNNGQAAATGVTLMLTSNEGLVTIIDADGSSPDISVGSSESSAADAFAIEISDAVDDTLLTLWIEVEAGGGSYNAVLRHDLHVDLSSTGVFDDPVPSVFRFHPCFPNPFNQATTMHLALPEVGPVRLRIYSPSGRLVKTVHDGEVPAGNHVFAWDGTDSGGYAVGSGVYFIRLEAGAREDTHKVVLLR